MGEPFCVSENFWYRKTLSIRGGGVSRFSVGNFLSHSAEKHRGGTLLCFRKFGASKKKLRIIGGYYDFASKIFSFTVPKKFVGGPLCFRNVLVSKNFSIIGVSLFCRIFQSHSAEKFRGGTLLCFGNLEVSKNFMHISGVLRFFIKKFQSHSTELFRRGYPRVSEMFWYQGFSDNKGTTILPELFSL